MDSEKLGFSYLKACLDTGLGVRVMPIGMVRFDIEPWCRVPHAFMPSLKADYINVVCAPPGIPMGAAVSATQFGNEQAKQEGAVYEPPTALSGLFTVGVANIAILTGKGEISPKELEALKLYESVVCPTEEGAEELAAQGVRAVSIPPESDQLSELFSGMNSA